MFLLLGLDKCCNYLPEMNFQTFLDRCIFICFLFRCSFTSFMCTLSPPVSCLSSTFSPGHCAGVAHWQKRCFYPWLCAACIVAALKSAVSNDKICMGTVLFLYFKAQINQLHVSPSACFRNILNEVPGIEKVSVHLQYIFSAEEAFREHLEFQNSTNHIFQLSKIIFVPQQPLYHDHHSSWWSWLCVS